MKSSAPARQSRPAAKGYVPPGRSNIANRKPGVSAPRNTSLVNRGKAPVKPAQVKVDDKPEAPVVDTRTAEEIDASYKKNLARFKAATDAFNKAYASKLDELKAAYGLPTIAAMKLDNGNDEEKKSDGSGDTAIDTDDEKNQKQQPADSKDQALGVLEDIFGTVPD